MVYVMAVLSVNEIIISTMDEPAEEVTRLIGAGDVQTVHTKRATILKFLETNEWDEKKYKLWLLSGGAKKLPPKKTMLTNAMKSALEAAKKPIHRVSEEERDRRLSVCRDCLFFVSKTTQCSQCGCFLNFKTRLEAWHCPIEKW